MDELAFLTIEHICSFQESLIMVYSDAKILNCIFFLNDLVV